MCGTALLIASGAMLAGAGVSAYGQYQTAGAYGSMGGWANSQAQIEAKVMEINAGMAEWEAGSYQRLGMINQVTAEADAVSIERAALRSVRRFRRQVTQLESSQVSAYSAAGFAPGEGLAEILNETASLADEDIAAIMEAGEMDARRSRLAGQAGMMQAGMLSTQSATEAALTRVGAHQIRLRGYYDQSMGNVQAWASKVGAFGSLLSGVGQTASLFYSPTKKTKQA